MSVTQKKRKKVDYVGWLRRLSQLGFSAYIVIAAVIHNTGNMKTASTDALCPFGGIETIWRFITSNGTAYCPKTHPSNLVLAVGLLLGVVIAGGAFCGWVCPFGAVQDALDWVRRKLRLPTVRVPAKLDKILRYGRYVVLAGILYATISTVTLWFADFDPYRTLFGLGWIFEFNLAEQWPAYAITIGVLIAAFFIPRLWCRYLCPLGAIVGLFQRISPLKIRRDKNLCIDCGRCNRACPMKLEIASKNAVNFDCTACQKCTSVCPVPGALNVGLGELKLAEPAAQEASK